MTISEGTSAPQPQDPPRQQDRGLQSYIQALAEQAFANRAKELSDRAGAAEEHSRRLAERVALLEGDKDQTEDDVSPLLNNVDGVNLRHSNHGLADAADEEAVSSTPDDNLRQLLYGEGIDPDSFDGEKDISDDNKCTLPESTFSLLITEPPCSIPFAYSVISIALSLSCLSLTLASSVAKGTTSNPLGMPGGVTEIVRAAQFLGAFVGVLMEDEIPQGLQNIANVFGNKIVLHGQSQKKIRIKVVTSSMIRLCIGYLFLSSLFINICQNDDVIEIFYDVLALEFVENIDDTSFALAKRGFFGNTMLIATTRKVFASKPQLNHHKSYLAGSISSNSRLHILVRLVYFLNALIILSGMVAITVTQNNGEFRCKTVMVSFDEEIWENAHVRVHEDIIEQRLLMYSYFNGIYKEDGEHDGYPRYIEQSKHDSTPFQKNITVGAEIKYCSDIGSWVFMHPNILTSPGGDMENECSWLWRSPPTQSFDLLSTTNGDWDAWNGKVKHLTQVSMTCNECYERSDCNYHGSCEKNKCVCYDSHFGDSCEFEFPCRSLATEKAQWFDPEKGVQWEQDNPIRLVEGNRIYNRPLYIQKGLSGQPYDMRLYKILRPDSELAPSSQPTDVPSASGMPTSNPSHAPSGNPSISPTAKPSLTPSKSSLPSSSPHPTYPYGEDWMSRPTGYSGKSGKSGNKGKGSSSSKSAKGSASSSYDGDDYVPIEYDLNPDFADFDDFFESKGLHDLEDILDDYSIIISFSGSRFFGTIVEPDSQFEDLFPPDYHAFWSVAFNENRTFIISDTAAASTPVGIDFFEMRRRVPRPMLNQNVKFDYGPFGALIPLMSYQDSGFFHCLEVTSQPSISPSSSGLPTSSPTDCTTVDISIFHDDYPEEISWEIYKANITEEGNAVVGSPEDSNISDYSLQSSRVCLPEGAYEFIINDSFGDGIYSPGNYSVTSHGKVIAHGGDFGDSETIYFSLPFVFVPKPSTSPSLSISPTEKCYPTSVNIFHDSWPHDISWIVHKIATKNGTQSLIVKQSEEYYSGDALSLRSSQMCLQEGEYQFTIRDDHGDGIRPPGYYNLMAYGEVLVRGGRFRQSKTYLVSIPEMIEMIVPMPSSVPSMSQIPSSSIAPSVGDDDDWTPSTQFTSPSFDDNDDWTPLTSFTSPSVDDNDDEWTSLPTVPPSPSPTQSPSCTNTPGYVDMYGDGCEYYEEEATFPYACQRDGDKGDDGMTPNENCCACKEVSESNKNNASVSD